MSEPIPMSEVAARLARCIEPDDYAAWAHQHGVRVMTELADYSALKATVAASAAPLEVGDNAALSFALRLGDRLREMDRLRDLLDKRDEQIAQTAFDRDRAVSERDALVGEGEVHEAQEEKLMTDLEQAAVAAARIEAAVMVCDNAKKARLHGAALAIADEILRTLTGDW